VVDGEIVAFDGAQTRFERLQHRFGVIHPSEALLLEVPVYYFVFDVLYADGRDVRPLPLRQRKNILAGSLEFRDPLRSTEQRERDGEAFFAQACRDGWEGLIAKRADAPYRGGRSRDWLKFRCLNAQEFVIGGYTDPQRSRMGFGALLLGYHDADGALVYAGKVGTGFDTGTLHDLRARLAGIERASPAFGKGRCPAPGGCTGWNHAWSPRSGSPSGPMTANSANRGSTACATTRTRPRWSGRSPHDGRRCVQRPAWPRSGRGRLPPLTVRDPL
jgi:bifunctional non-homologous end joining protein LigD